jgi:purine catabolism regulator
MLPEASLQLTLLAEGLSLDRPIQWVHSSDLADPTPFLGDGHMLLTTGTQFHDDATQHDYDAYIDRLMKRGVVALGFGTEVVRSGTPAELFGASLEAGLTLVEVPYLTPFIAIARWAADVISHEARERDDWSLSAQRAISLAAVGQRGLAGVLAVLAQQLGCRVAVFEPDGAFDAVLSPNSFGDNELQVLSSEAVRLLRAQRRSANSAILNGQRVTLQTLGPGGRLSGVIAIVGAVIDDMATKAVLTSAIALAEISFEESRLRRGNLMPLHGELLSLLLTGQSEVVLRALPRLPRTDLRVVLCNSDSQSQWLIEALERRATTSEAHLFLAPRADNLVVLLPSAEWPSLKDFLGKYEVTTGVSESTDVARLTSGLSQASHALVRSLAAGGGITEFSEVSDGAFLEIMSGQTMVDLAKARLAPLLDEDRGRAMLEDTFVWLAHNGGWDSAAKQLGMHRHSLKLRVETVAKTLSLSLYNFADRAQLWSMLYALDFGAGTGASLRTGD